MLLTVNVIMAHQRILKKGGVSVKYCKCGVQIKPKNTTCINCVDRANENNPFYNKQHSENTKKLLSENRLGKLPSNVKPVKIDGVIYESLMESSRQIDIPVSTILWRIKSKNVKYASYTYI
jgi:hypothetical protein